MANYLGNSNIKITRYLPNMLDLCYYSSLVISGGGTIVRESSLLNVPSIEFFPGETAPQERFLINNGFPLQHLKEIDAIVKKSLEILSAKPKSNRFNKNYLTKILNFENPNDICYKIVKKNLLERS